MVINMMTGMMFMVEMGKRIQGRDSDFDVTEEQDR